MTTSQFDQIPEQALAWHTAGQGAALATVIETWGSAPRRVGSQLAINSNGEIMGSVSGGCVEGAVIVEAIEAIDEGGARELEFGVADEDAFAVGLACGGTIRILVEPVGSALPEAMLRDLVEARIARKAIAYEVDLDRGKRALHTSGFEDRFRLDRSGFEEGSRRFIAIHNPPLRLVVVGAVHIAQTLMPMAQMLGFDPVLVDPRETFAAQARFPGQSVINDWPGDVIAHIGLDARSALVLLSHDPKLDDPALEVALRSPCFYIGALGSTRTHAKRVARLQDAGFSEAQIARIHGPVGLDIGAAGPSEIALSVMAEMVSVLRKGRS